MVNYLSTCLLCLVALLLQACVSTGVTLNQVEISLRHNDPETALVQLERISKSTSNELLYYLNAGLIYRQNNQLKKSIQAFTAAKKLFDIHEITSISQTAGAWTLSEYSKDYEAYESEKMMLFAFQILNYLELGQYQGARIEIQQVQNYLQRYPERKYFGSAAFALYLSGLVYQLNNEADNALIAFRKAYQRFVDNNQAVPQDLQQQLLNLTHQLALNDENQSLAQTFGRPPGRSASPKEFKLLFIHKGLLPPIRENDLTLPEPKSGKLHRIALPYMEQYSDLDVFFLRHGKERWTSQLAIDVNSAMRDNIKDRIPKLTARALSRAIAHSKAVDKVAEESSILGKLINAAGVIAQSADTRHWRILPKSIHVLRFDDSANNITLFSHRQQLANLTQLFAQQNSMVRSYYINQG